MRLLLSCILMIFLLFSLMHFSNSANTKKGKIKDIDVKVGVSKKKSTHKNESKSQKKPSKTQAKSENKTVSDESTDDDYDYQDDENIYTFLKDKSPYADEKEFKEAMKKPAGHHKRVRVVTKFNSTIANTTERFKKYTKSGAFSDWAAPEMLLLDNDDRFYQCKNGSNNLFHEAYRFNQNNDTLIFFETAGNYTVERERKNKEGQEIYDICGEEGEATVGIASEEDYLSGEYIYHIKKDKVKYVGTIPIMSTDQEVLTSRHSELEALDEKGLLHGDNEYTNYDEDDE